MTRRLIPLLAALALLAGACGGDEPAATTPAAETTTPATAQATTTPAADSTTVVTLVQDSGTLTAVRDRGSLRCGVSTSAIGFAEPQDDGSFKGFDADFCRAVGRSCPR